jgi:hypothetical protein
MKFTSRLVTHYILTLLLVGSALADPIETAAPALNEQAIAAHRQRNLGEASRFYARVLKLDSPVEPTAAQRALVLKFAPRLHTVSGEFFPLKNIAALVHPDRPVIGYHLFWDDDIAYPSDNEPCDHEIVWVEYDPATEQVVRVFTYFHGKILSPDAAVAEANAHGGQPWIGVEWGFHGSIPWQSLNDVATKLREHWNLAHQPANGRKRDPLARGWPERFPGDYDAYVTFEVTKANAVARLKEDDLVFVSRWPLATLNRYCLRYNFAAKTEWPWLAELKK